MAFRDEPADLYALLEPLIAQRPESNPWVLVCQVTCSGRAYVKQVDVVIAQWSRGAELLVSTKTTIASFRKNLANRFEEEYGNAKNRRGRYPLVAMGFLFVLMT